MQVYIWHHNRKFHSYSMINEPCINNKLYQEAVLIVLADSLQEAINTALLQNDGWQAEDLAQLTPQVLDLKTARVAFSSLT